MLRTTAATVIALVGFPPVGFAQSSGSRAETRPGRDVIDVFLEWIANGIEVTGVAIMVIGAIAATLVFLHGGLGTVGWPAAYDRYRANLGRGILLGLELLVAADIIGTVAVTPSIENLAVLAFIVLIRTFLSFSLEVEIEGRWPWRRAEAEAQRHSPSSQGG